MAYAPYHPMVEDARKRPAVLRLIAGFLTAIVVLFAWIAGFIYLVGWLRGESFLQSANSTLSLGEQTPASAVIYLLLVCGLGVGTAIAARVWHKRTLRSLIGPGGRTFRHFIAATTVTFTAIGVISLISSPFSDPLELNMDLSMWLIWLPLGLFAVAMQTLSEELLFRGYLQSQLAGRFRNPALWLILPALIFGVVHYLPTLPLTAALTYVTVAALFGVLAGDLTARTGSLGAAWGFHFANNCTAILFVATEGSLTGLGLYRTPGGLQDEIALSPFILIDVLALVAIYALIRRFLRP